MGMIAPIRTFACQLCAFVLCLLPAASLADDRQVALYAAPELVETGLFKHILPRFALKTQVRVTLVPDPAAAQITLGSEGRPLFNGLDQTWNLDVLDTGHKGTDRFADWLRSDVGRRTVTGFAPEGVALFAPPADAGQVVAEITYDGDAKAGHKVSRDKCTRCHTVDDESRMMGIGSTPSFAVLRSLSDWEDRFAAFYVLKPHGAFTQITDVTEPFPAERPSPIHPIELTIEEVEAVLAYVASMPAADLGAPLAHQ